MATIGVTGGERGASELGQLLAVYRNGRSFALKAWLLGPFVMLIGGTLLAAGLLDENSDQAGLGTTIFAIALCLAIFALGAALPIIWIKNSSLRVRLYEGGLVWARSNEERRILWAEAVGFLRASTRVSMHGIPVGTARQYTLEDARGQRIKLNQHLDHLDQLAVAIEKEVWARLRPRVRQALDRGQSVSFGPLELGPAGIAHKGRRLDWGAFERFAVVAGMVQIFERGRKRPVFSILYGQVRNATLLLEELRRRAPV